MAKKNRKNRPSTRREQVGQAISQTAAGAGLTAAADEVRSTLDSAATITRERTQQRLEQVGPTGRALVTERGVPLWCVRLHQRVGHVPGAIVFAVITALAWSLGISLVATLLRIIGVQAVTVFPTWVLEQMNVPVETAVSSTDRFLFTWVMPTLFFVLVAAGLALMAVMGLVRWGRRWTWRLALGLFAGYGTGIGQDRIERAQAGAAARKQREAARTERREQRDRAREQVRAAKARNEQL